MGLERRLPGRLNYYECGKQDGGQLRSRNVRHDSRHLVRAGLCDEAPFAGFRLAVVALRKQVLRTDALCSDSRVSDLTRARANRHAGRDLPEQHAKHA